MHQQAPEAHLISQLELNNSLGEGIQWNPQDQCIWWTDILSASLYRYHLDSQELSRFALPENLGSFGFSDQPDWLVCAFASGFAYFNPFSGALQWLHRLPDYPALRLNDGKVDPRGRFWAGSMIDNATNDGPIKGSLFCLERGELSIKRSGIRISNGLCWAPDGCTQYFADSPSQTIVQFEFDVQAGTQTNARPFVNTQPGYPDGATIDSQGRLWSALWGTGQIACYSAQGEPVATVTVPATQVSCVAFGGPALDLLFVTSAQVGLDDTARVNDPYAGSLFIYQTNTRGLIEPRYRW